MRYDENLNYNYIFSTEQSVGSVPGPYCSEYESQKQALINEGIRPKPHYVAKNLGRLLEVLLPGIFIAGILFLANRIVSMLTGNAILFHIALAVGALTIGIISLPGFTDLTTKFSFMEDKARKLALSLTCFAAAILSVALHFTLNMVYYEKSVFNCACILVIAAFYNLIALIMTATEGSRIYKRTIENAKVIGYVRIINTARSMTRRNQISCYTSPVFEYMADGDRIHAFYDRLIKGPDADISLGTIMKLKANAKEPWMLKSPDKARTVTNIILLIVFALVAALLFYAVFTGGVDESSISIYF